MLYKYELKKIWGNRFFVVVLIILLLTNGVLAYIDATPSGSIPADVVTDLVAEYLKDPTAMDEYKQKRDTAKKLFMESSDYETGKKFSDVVPNVYSKSEDYDDDRLLNVLYNTVLTRSDTVASRIGQVVSSGKNNQRLLLRRGVKEHEFLYVYQQKAIDTYTELKQPVVDSIRVEYERGWGTWLGYNEGTVLLLVVLTLLGSISFGVEGRCHTMELLRTSKKGRSHTAVAKFGAAVTVGAVIAVMFCLSSFVGVGLMTGYSSPTNAIQLVLGYELVPFIATIWQYALIHVAGVVLAAVVFCVFAIFVAALCRGVAIAFGGGALFMALNLLLWKYNYTTTNNALKYLNLFAAADGQAMFSYVHGVSVFGKFVHCWVVLCALSVTLCFGLILIAVVSFARFGTKDLRIPFVKQLIGVVRTCIESIGDKTRNKHVSLGRWSSSLCGFEFYKMYLCRGLVFLLAILLVIKGVYTYDHYHAEFIEDEVYYSYISELQGEWNEQKHEYIVSELSWAESIIAKSDRMQQDYFDDKITIEEFRKYLEDYYFAERIIEPLKRLYASSNHLQKLSQEGIYGSFVYDTGWTKLNDREYDMFFYLIIVIAASISFSMEYNSNSSGGGFNQILRGTKRGRKSTFGAKLTANTVVCFATGIFCVGSDMINVIMLWRLPDGNVPLISLVRYADAPTFLTLRQYAAFICVSAVISMVLLGMGTFAISCLSGKLINCLTVVAIATLVPRTLSIVGVDMPVWCDYFRLQQADSLAIWSMQINILGGTGGYVLVGLLWIFATVVLMVAAWSKWIGKIAR